MLIGSLPAVGSKVTDSDWLDTRPGYEVPSQTLLAPRISHCMGIQHTVEFMAT